eukprot:2964750-Pyramimonas_sp.AAC.1
MGLHCRCRTAGDLWGCSRAGPKPLRSGFLLWTRQGVRAQRNAVRATFAPDSMSCCVRVQSRHVRAERG